MCYVLLLSTDSAEDLSAHNEALLSFNRGLPAGRHAGLLRYPYKWHVGTKSFCSCTLRHLHEPTLGFGRPVDWFPEESDAIEATSKLIRVIRQLVQAGAQVDCIDYWENDERNPADIAVMPVDLAQVANDEFRLFENYHFDFQHGG